MSVEPGSPSDEVYCDTLDVAIYFDKYEDFLDEGETVTDNDGNVTEQGPTDPTASEVEKIIEEKSDMIDRMTGHAWRERRVVDEYKRLDGVYRFSSGTPLSLMKRDIRTPLDPEKGDKLEFWTGSSYDDWVADEQKEEGRDGHYWFDESTGQLHVFRRQFIFNKYKEVRVTYRYGQEKTPRQIEQICAKLTAAELFRSQQYRVTTPGNEEAPDSQAVADKWIEEAEKQLERYKEVRSIGL